MDSILDILNALDVPIDSDIDYYIDSDILEQEPSDTVNIDQWYLEV